MTTAQTSNRHSQQLRKEAQIYANITFVLDKLEADRNIEPFANLLESVLGNEVAFALRALVKISETSTVPDLNAQLVRNTVIFKENLKLILNSLGSLISRHHLD